MYDLCVDGAAAAPPSPPPSHPKPLNERGTDPDPTVRPCILVPLKYAINHPVSFSILFYEYFLTLDWEISRFWWTQLSWPKALFFANRYGTLLGNIPVAMEYFWTGNSTPTKIKVSAPLCLGLESYHQYFFIASQVLVAAMLILRTYALYERSKRVLALMIAVAFGAVVVGIWSILSGKAVDKTTNLPLYIGCDYPTSKAQIFLLTLYKVFTRHPPNGTDLATVLLRDGSVYFGVMLLSNLANIATFVVSEFNQCSVVALFLIRALQLGAPYIRGIVTTFTNIISSVMITRLMLNIRDPALANMAGTHSTSVTADLRFAPHRLEGETGQAGVELNTDVNGTMGECISIWVDTYLS
ncbi:hypothetical protein DFH08DRAFT_811200 [Mycena albidolilacea]|uniref:DUF6533 domain-containing protein n=1 Tax=Mycena albidolilacea TaxID=1033008 RepID=A0AAD6ZWG9_9AGAR|nr:hypothetical protein DFH08DRAFT_811200 [Mycena albidolilacea]